MHLILKLVDSTDVIGKVERSEDGVVVLSEPMRIMYGPTPTGQTAGLMKYAYFTAQDMFEFKSNFIIQAYEPRVEFINYYTEAVEQLYRGEIATEHFENESDEEDSEEWKDLLELYNTPNTSFH